MQRIGLVIAVLAVAALALATSGPAHASRDCGHVTVYGKQEAVVALRGVTCRRARAVARSFAKGGPGKPWFCYLAHAPFKRSHGIEVHATCAYGGTRGDVRDFPHAFLLGKD